MNPNKLLNETVSRMNRFLEHIEVVDGVDLNSLHIEVYVRSQKHPDLKSIMLSGNNFVLKFADDNMIVKGDKECPSMPVDIIYAINAYEEQRKRNVFISNLITSIAKDGGVFVESISVSDLQRLQACWSDAYGEDHLELFTHKIKADIVRGYIRTGLTKEAIASKNDEDGPDIKNTNPLFDPSIPVCYIMK